MGEYILCSKGIKGRGHVGGGACSDMDGRGVLLSGAVFSFVESLVSTFGNLANVICQRPMSRSKLTDDVYI